MTVFNVVDELHRILNFIKGFSVGYSTQTASKGYFVFTRDDTVFKVHIEELGKVRDNDPVKTIREELKTLDKYVK